MYVIEVVTVDGLLSEVLGAVASVVSAGVAFFQLWS